MPSIAQLTTGCMETIMTGGECEKPILQILGAKKIAGGENERYRLLVSDGKYLNSFAMLATQLNDIYKEGNLVENTIIRVDRYITSMVNKSDKVDKRVLIILELTVLNHGAEVGKKIGNPVQFTGETSSAAKPAAPVPQIKNGLPATKSVAGNTYSSSSSNNFMNNNNVSLNQSTMGSMTVPIASLTPYQSKWVIKARVTFKSQIRTWNNARGEGKLFSIDLMDESGEIRATAFKEMCDRYYDTIEVDKVYLFSKCILKPANKQYTTIKNDYEMTFTNETVVQACDDEGDDGIPQVQYDFVPITQIANIEPKSAVDVIGVCRETGELQTFTSKANKEFKKRELTLVDTSNAAVNLTLWGEDAVNFETGFQNIILVKGARVTEFNGGKSLSMGSGTVMKINPDIPEGHRLRGWFDNGGGSNISSSISARTGAGSYNTDWLSFHEVRLKNLGVGEKPDYFQCKAVVKLIRSMNATYKACPQTDCNKKVIEENNGYYRCEKCNQAFPDFKYRLLMNMEIGDWSSGRWVTCFSDLAEQLLGKTAKEVGEAVENDPQETEQIFSSLNFHEFIFKLRVKVEQFGDMSRNKLTVVAASPVNYKEYNKYLVNSLKELTGIARM